MKNRATEQRNAKNANEVVKRKRGRPFGSKSNRKKIQSQEIIKRALNYALEDMGELTPQLIKEALINDIRDIKHFAFLFPNVNQLNIKADSLVNTLSEVSGKISEFKKRKNVIDITPTKETGTKLEQIENKTRTK